MSRRLNVSFERFASQTTITISILIAAFLVSAAHAVPASADQARSTVEEILASHLEAIGGKQAVDSIHSIVSKGQVEIVGAGFTGTIESYEMSPCLSYNEISLQIFKVKRGFDGVNLWTIDQNGKLVLAKDENSIKGQRTSCLISSFGYIHPGKDITVEIAPADTVDGSPCDCIKYSSQEILPFYLYIDSSTHLIRRIKTETAMGAVDEFLSDYRKVNGVMFPFKVRAIYLQAMQEIVTTYDSIDVNKAIDPSIFLPPTKDIVDYTFTNGSDSSTVDMQYIFDHLFVSLKFDKMNEPSTFMIDSGAGKTVIDSALAVKLGLSLGGKIPGAGAGGMAYFYIVRIPAFSVGDIRFDEQTVFSFPLSKVVGNIFDRPISGILGYDFLSRFTTRIDYENNRITFFSSKAQRAIEDATAAANAIEIDAPLINNLFSLPCTVNGKYKGKFILDTGANTSMLQKDFVEKNDLKKSLKTLDVSIRGAGGEAAAELTRLKSFGFDGISFKGPIFTISKEKKGIGAFTGIDGIIGNNILKRFTLTLDYANQRVVFVKNRNFDAPFLPDKSGIILTRNEAGQTVVHVVIPHSPAYRAGVRKGDVILKINGRKPEKFAGIDDINRLFRGRTGKRIKLLLKRGNKKITVFVRLKRYI